MSQSRSKSEKLSPGLKLALDLGPLAIFFAAFRFGDLMIATGALMLATVVTLIITYAFTKRIAVIPLVTGVMVMIFGGLTLWLNSELFIKLKLTIIYVLLGLGMLIGLLFGKPAAKVMLESAINMPEANWVVFTFRVAVMFLTVAVLNEVARQYLTTEQWVNFKVIGVPVLMFVFFIANAPYLMRHQIEDGEGTVLKDDAPAGSTADERTEKS